MGMSDEQAAAFTKWLLSFGPEVTLHHGDCVGSDAQADAIARELGARIEIHPPEREHMRAFCGRDGDKVWPVKPFLERDRDIVDSSFALFGATRTREHAARRSGTWFTIRYARHQGKPVHIE